MSMNNENDYLILANELKEQYNKMKNEYENKIRNLESKIKKLEEKESKTVKVTPENDETDNLEEYPNIYEDLYNYRESRPMIQSRFHNRIYKFTT